MWRLKEGGRVVVAYADLKLLSCRLHASGAGEERNSSSHEHANTVQRVCVNVIAEDRQW